MGTREVSGAEGRKISPEEVQHVQNGIERCLRHYMNPKEVLNALLVEEDIDPDFTELVWQKLEEENQEFFKAYYLRLMVKQQIMEFNKLLSEQAELMYRLGQGGIVPMAMSNGSQIPSMHQNSGGCCTVENTSTTLKPENVHHAISASLPSLYNNCGSSLPLGLQKAIDMPLHGRTIDVSGNRYLTQCSNKGIAHPIGGMMMKPEPSYAGSSTFEFSAHNNLVKSRPILGEAPVSSFNSSVESNSQLNDTLLDLDLDPSSFGYFGQISQNMGLSDLGANFTNGSDFFGSYSRSVFLPTDTTNFVDPLGSSENQADIVGLNAPPESLADSLRYEDIIRK